MELTFIWFWLVQLALLGTFAYFVYKAYTFEFRNYVWNVLTGFTLLLLVVQPIKMEQANLNTVHHQEQQHIEKTKNLPSMITDHSFTDKVNKQKEITAKNLK